MPFDPPFSLSRMIKLAFKNACKLLNRLFTSQTEISLRTPPSPSCNITTRIRCLNLTASPPFQNQHLLPLYNNNNVNAIEMETTTSVIARPSQKKSGPMSSMAKTILNLAALGIFQNIPSSSGEQKQPQEQEQQNHPVFVAAMVIAFAASFSAMFLRRTWLATVFEKIGYYSFAIGFFVIISALLSGGFVWMGWLAWALSLLLITIIARFT